MKSLKPRTNLRQQRRRRAHLVQIIMEDKGLTIQRAAEKTGIAVNNVYKAIDSRTPGHEAISFLEKRLGKGFTDNWLNNPKHSAA